MDYRKNHITDLLCKYKMFFYIDINIRNFVNKKFHLPYIVKMVIVNGLEIAIWGRIGFDRDALGLNCSRVMTLSSNKK